MDFLHQLLRQPAVLAEEIASRSERPDEMRVEQHRAGQHANRRERGRAGGREPELVPRFPDFGDVVARGGDHRRTSRPATSERSYCQFGSAGVALPAFEL